MKCPVIGFNYGIIDNNPSFTSVQTVFHGTAISRTQHFTNDCADTELQKTAIIDKNMPRTRKLKLLFHRLLSHMIALLHTIQRNKPLQNPVDSDDMQLHVAWVSSVENLLKKKP